MYRDSARFAVDGDAGEVSFDRRYHAPAPVFADYGDPVAGKVDGAAALAGAEVAGAWGWARRLAAVRSATKQNRIAFTCPRLL